MSYATAARFADYRPADFGWADRDPRDDSGLLTPFEHSGVAFGSMHVDVVAITRALFDVLVPLIPGGLVPGQCGCYNPKSETVGGDRSFHTYGIATDTNWGTNVMGLTARPTGPHALPGATAAIARSFGFEWGGSWSYPQDWMHLECHLTPAQASAYKPTPNATPGKEDDDDMALITVTQTTHPTTKKQRYFITGPKGIVETTKAGAAGAVSSLGLTLVRCDEGSLAVSRAAVTSVLG